MNQTIETDHISRSQSIFNSIAWIYGLLTKSIEKGLRPAARLLADRIDLEGKSVLDVGTGTGAWANLLYQNGASVTGIDHAQKMLEKGRKQYGDAIRFIHGDGNNLDIFPDGTFDIVTASYVLHGMNREQREPLLLEMKRVGRELVVFNDYDKGASPFALFLEWLEKSDYHNFVENFHHEMGHYFNDCSKLPMSKGHALYIGCISPAGKKGDRQVKCPSSTF